MSLLPKSHSDFSSKSYWESFFKKRGTKAFEWYGEYNTLCGILHKYIKQTDDTLIVGCGNSQIGADLYDVGYRKLINIDISDVVIRQMNDLNKKQRPDLQFVKMDMLQMSYEENGFSVVFDKGTLDALMPDDDAETVATVDKMFSEISRVLRVGGRYICVSLAQEHIIQKLVHFCTDSGWMLRVCRVQHQDEDLEHHMPVFVFVCTKFKKLPNMKPVLEVCNFDDQIERLSSIDELLSSVKAMQYYGVVRQNLNKRMTDGGEPICVELFGPQTTTPRYTLHIVDSRKTRKNKFAVFIVPEGRETDWQFNTDEGRRQVADSAKFQRLVVVLLSYDHSYTNLEQIKAELSTKVMELAPPGLVDKMNQKMPQVPFLSIGEDINLRTVLYEGESDFSGRFVVQDVQVDETTMRRLVFRSNTHVVQSEALLRTVSNKSKAQHKSSKHRSTTHHNSSTTTSVQPTLDHSYLPTYLSVATAGLALVQNLQQCLDTQLDFTLLGLGGGVYASFLSTYLKNVHIQAVEIDEAVVDVARNWFGLVTSDKLNVHIEDAVAFTQMQTERGIKSHVVMVNIDNKDLKEGLTGPSQAFLSKQMLQALHNVLHSSGALMLNLVCRNAALQQSILRDIQDVFPVLLRCKIDGDVNQMVFALPAPRTDVQPDADTGALSPTVKANLRALDSAVKPTNKSDTLPKFVSMLNDLEVVT